MTRISISIFVNFAWSPSYVASSYVYIYFVYLGLFITLACNYIHLFQRMHLQSGENIKQIVIQPQAKGVFDLRMLRSSSNHVSPPSVTDYRNIDIIIIRCSTDSCNELIKVIYLKESQQIAITLPCWTYCNLGLNWTMARIDPATFDLNSRSLGNSDPNYIVFNSLIDWSTIECKQFFGRKLYLVSWHCFERCKLLPRLSCFA